MEFIYQVNQQLHRVRVEREADIYRVSVDGSPLREVQFTRDDTHTIRLRFHDRQQRVHIASNSEVSWLALGSAVYALRALRHSEARPATSADDASSLQAQMPGQVVAVAV